MEKERMEAVMYMSPEYQVLLGNKTMTFFLTYFYMED